MESRKLVNIKTLSVQCGRTESDGSNTIAACVNVLFIHLRSMTGLARKNIASLHSLTCGGMNTANTQNILFNPNSTKLFAIYGHAVQQLLELTFILVLSVERQPKYTTAVKTDSVLLVVGMTQSDGLKKLKGTCLTFLTGTLSLLYLTS
jgi:hypothetical protein